MQIEVLAPPASVQQHQDFAREILDRIAAACGISYEMLSADWRRCHPIISTKMLRLCDAVDRRKRRRGLRLYFKVNGRSAPVRPLLETLVDLTRQRAARRFADRVYQDWLREARQRGEIPALA